MKTIFWVSKDVHGTYLYRKRPEWHNTRWRDGMALVNLGDDYFPDLKDGECIEVELKPIFKEPEHEYYGC